MISRRLEEEEFVFFGESYYELVEAIIYRAKRDDDFETVILLMLTLLNQIPKEDIENIISTKIYDMFYPYRKDEDSMKIAHEALKNKINIIKQAIDKFDIKEVY